MRGRAFHCLGQAGAQMLAELMYEVLLNRNWALRSAVPCLPHLCIPSLSASTNGERLYLYWPLQWAGRHKSYHVRDARRWFSTFPNKGLSWMGVCCKCCYSCISAPSPLQTGLHIGFSARLLRASTLGGSQGESFPGRKQGRHWDTEGWKQTPTTIICAFDISEESARDMPVEISSFRISFAIYHLFLCNHFKFIAGETPLGSSEIPPLMGNR